jgi:FKBP-type peptidyl-prolyl cis-trans isomerase SlyD
VNIDPTESTAGLTGSIPDMTETPKQTEVVRAGKLVALTYSIRDEQGNILEQTDLPVTYIHGGNNELIGGMDQAVTGKSVGDELQLRLSPEQSGFGSHDPELTFTDMIDNVPPELRHLGAEVNMQNDAGEVRTFYVTRIEDGRLTVDGNHPFAGKHLTVNVRIHEVRDPTLAELKDDVGDTPRVLH